MCSWFRHVQQSIRMALATARCTPRTALQGARRLPSRLGRGGVRCGTRPSSGGPLLPQPELFHLHEEEPSGVQHLCLRLLVRRTGHDGVLWSRSSRVSCRSRFSMFLSRWSSWVAARGADPDERHGAGDRSAQDLLPRQASSRCSRRHADGGISWWKCWLSRLSQSSSCILSIRTLTFQFMVVQDKVQQVVVGLTVEVFPQDRVQQRIAFVVATCLPHYSCSTLRRAAQKKCQGHRALECESARAL